MNKKRHPVTFGVALATLLTGSAFAVGATPIASAAGLPVQAVPPARLADTRVGKPEYTTIDHQFEAIGRQKAGSQTNVIIGGRGGVPADASAAFLNLTDVHPSQDNFLTVYPGPCTTQPDVSNVNGRWNSDTANNAFVQLGPNRGVCVYTEKETDFLIDVTGFVPRDGSPVAVAPTRIANTRSRNIANLGGRRAAKSHTDIQIAGLGGVPANATGAIINLTAVQPSAGTLLAVYPGRCDHLKEPHFSNVNGPAHQDTAGSVFTQLGTNGGICVYTVAETDLIVDVNGYIPPANSPTAFQPLRFAETRTGPNDFTFDNKYTAIGRVEDKKFKEIQIAGRADVPSTATAAFVNLTATQPTNGTFLTVYPCTTTVPNASTVNALPKSDRANSAFVQLSPRGTVCVYADHASDFALDVSGYVAPAK